MAVFNRKVRMVSFRLSDEEYQQALRACLAQGIRSVSALARQSVLSLGLPDRSPSASAPPTDGLQSQVATLTEALGRAIRLLDVSRDALTNATASAAVAAANAEAGFDSPRHHRFESTFTPGNQES